MQDYKRESPRSLRGTSSLSSYCMSSLFFIRLKSGCSFYRCMFKNLSYISLVFGTISFLPLKSAYERKFSKGKWKVKISLNVRKYLLALFWEILLPFETFCAPFVKGLRWKAWTNTTLEKKFDVDLNFESFQKLKMSLNERQMWKFMFDRKSFNFSAENVETAVMRKQQEFHDLHSVAFMYN